jgi:hypothetical protein
MLTHSPGNAERRPAQAARGSGQHQHERAQLNSSIARIVAAPRRVCHDVDALCALSAVVWSTADTAWRRNPCPLHFELATDAYAVARFLHQLRARLESERYA